MPRTKMTRHQLKEQDEITTSLKTFTDLVMARQKEVTIGVSAIALLAIGPWLVAGKFQTVRKTDPGPGVGDVGSKPAAPTAPEKIRR